jgi:hypothetical protein
MSNGKGDAARPFSVDGTTFANNWERIFGKKQEVCEYSHLPAVTNYEVDQTPHISPENNFHDASK